MSSSYLRRTRSKDRDGAVEKCLLEVRIREDSLPRGPRLKTRSLWVIIKRHAYLRNASTDRRLNAGVEERLLQLGALNASLLRNLDLNLHNVNAPLVRREQTSERRAEAIDSVGVRSESPLAARCWRLV